MAKTCRTCKHQVPWIRCERHQIWLHKKFTYTVPGESRDCHEPRETPLLVDGLAETLDAILKALNSHWFVYTKLPGAFQSAEDDERKAQELVDQAYVLLARHQEEVGDAKVS